MSKGGKRIGAGPKPRAGVIAKNHSIKFTDVEWEAVKKKAKAKNLTASDYVRKKTLKEEANNVKHEFLVGDDCPFCDGKLININADKEGDRVILGCSVHECWFNKVDFK